MMIKVAISDLKKLSREMNHEAELIIHNDQKLLATNLHRWANDIRVLCEHILKEIPWESTSSIPCPKCNHRLFNHTIRFNGDPSVECTHCRFVRSLAEILIEHNKFVQEREELLQNKYSHE